jgi:hypothetical protein
MLNDVKNYFGNEVGSNIKVAQASSEKISLEAGKIISICTNNANCFKDALLAKVKSGQSAEDSIALFTAITENSEGMSGGCNSVGRSLGEELFNKFGKKVFSNYSVICGHAYAYGFLIGLGKKSPDETKGTFLKDYCIKDVNPVSCVYGVGYALSFATKNGKEAQERCFTAGDGLSKVDPKLIPSFQMTGPGDCILGWASGVMDNLIVNKPNIKDALSICNGMDGGSYKVCAGEASFAYSFQNHPEGPERLIRLKEIRERCQSDDSYECMQFLGKATVDYLIYTLKIDLKSDSMARQAANTIELLCTGNNAQACLMGSIQDQLTHTTHDDMMRLCSLFIKPENKTRKFYIFIYF